MFPGNPNHIRFVRQNLNISLINWVKGKKIFMLLYVNMHKCELYIIPSRAQRMAMFSPCPSLSCNEECMIFPWFANFIAKLCASRSSLLSSVSSGTLWIWRLMLCADRICSLNFGNSVACALSGDKNINISTRRESHVILLARQIIWNL